MIAHWLDKYIRDQQQPATRLIQAVSKFEFTEEEETKMPKPHSGYANHVTEQVCLLMSNDWNYYSEIKNLEERPTDFFNVLLFVRRMRQLKQLSPMIKNEPVNTREAVQHAQYIWDCEHGLDT